MILKFDVASRSIAKAAALMLVAAGVTACSSVPSWVDPTTWIGGDDKAAQTPDETAAENSPTPDITSVPGKPPPPSTSDEQKQVSDSLAADKAQAQYSGDQLRGGTEPAAAPPPDAPPAVQVADTAASSPANPATNPPPAADQTASASTPAPTADQTASTSAPAPSSSSDQSLPGTLPSTSASAPSSSDAAAPASPATPSSASAPAADTSTAAAPASNTSQPATVASASLPPPSGSTAPAMSSATSAAPRVAGASDSLGFQRSNAPPLDASVSQFVPQSIMSRYQQTASLSGAAGIQKGGAVSTNIGAFQPSAISSASGIGASTVVMFPNDTTSLSADARSQIRAAAKTYRSNGGQGYVRVVGHASAEGANASAQTRMMANFERSQARAKAVAAELIHDGVPASKVLVEAVGDSEPTAGGEDANRSAEIFFQS
jgi:outer membrane protein OmpA-like peptidoglycan-associated protein